MQLTKSGSHQHQETKKDAQEESREEICEEMRLQVVEKETIMH